MPPAAERELAQHTDQTLSARKKPKWPSFKTKTKKTINEKVKLLKETPVINTSTDPALASLASHLTFKKFTKASTVHIKEDFIIILSGSISFYDRLGVVMKAYQHFIFVQGIHPSCDAAYYIAAQDSTVLHGKKRPVLDCLSENATLLKNLFNYFLESNESRGLWRIQP